MNVIVITSEGKKDDELPTIIELLNNGLQTLHIRKPKWKKSEIEDFIKAIPVEYHKCLVLHGNYRMAMKYNLKGIHLHRKHRSGKFKNRWKRFMIRLLQPGMYLSTTFHSIQSFRENNVRYDYVFLSQVFHSQTHFNHSDASGINLLRNAISESKTQVFATGGIRANNIPIIKAAGFAGVGLSSVIWSKPTTEATASFEAFNKA